MRSARRRIGIAVTALVGATAVAVVLFPLTARSADAPSARSQTGPYTGVGTGTVDRFRHVQTSSVTSDSKDVYNVRFTYSFRIENGRVVGRGDGVYQSATWHLSGTYNGQGFNCDVPIATRPFSVAVTGTATTTRVKLRFQLEGASETNADYDCGANYTGFSTTSTYVAESLALVQADQPGGVIDVSRTSPSIPPLRKLVETGPQTDRRVNLHEWTITIRAPAGSGGGGGAGGSGGGGAANPNGSCTITGTPRSDTLVGTARRDVICGLGGNDVLRGLGGNDVLRGGAGRDSMDGGSGNDFFAARDHTRDVVTGGPGKDRGTVDRGVDRVSSVETLS